MNALLPAAIGGGAVRATVGPVSVRRRGRIVVLCGAAVLLAAAGACSGPGYDRDGAVDDVLARYGERLTRAQAECYVDRVVDQLGTGALDEEDPSPERIPRLTRIRVDCAGVVSLGTSVPPTLPPPAPGDTTPRRRGEDPDFDRLWDQCQAGAGAACDRLFDEAPPGSEYEQFAITCGNRTSEVRCAEKYPG
jgi:hypothetical protein